MNNLRPFLTVCRNMQQAQLRTCHTMKKPSSQAIKNCKVAYTVIPKERHEIVSTHLIDHYHPIEPMSQALGLGREEIKSWFPQFLEKNLLNTNVTSVSVEVYDKTAQKRIGMLTALIVDPTKPELYPLSSFVCPKKHPVNAAMNEFFDTLERDLDKVKAGGINVAEGEQPPPKILEILYATCLPEYAGMGIAENTLQITEALASGVHNCRLVYALCTSEFSYRVMRKYGYKAVREIHFKDYENSKGEKIFADKLDRLKPHYACRSVMKQLKNYHE